MSNPYSRWKYLYDKRAIPNLASTFPIHVFVRSPNMQSDWVFRDADRTNCFDSTLVHLTERFNHKEVFLVGTANVSTMLAQRTQKLIREVKPDRVLVQTNEKWWNVAKMLRYVNSQEEFKKYEKTLKTTLEYQFPNNTRRIPFKYRIFLLRILLPMIYRYNLGREWNPLLPGIEIKFALQEAERAGAQLQFLGPELNDISWNNLYHETRYNPFYTIINYFRDFLTPYFTERIDNIQKFHKLGATVFAETCLEPELVNWYIMTLEKYFPELKRIFIDKKDAELFEAIDQAEGKRIVAVVNQWHMEGIEHQWAHSYGQLPRSVQIREPMTPIGDMDLQQGLWDLLYNDLQRRIKSAHSKSVPSSWNNWPDLYGHEAYFQYEHRNM